EVQQDLKTQKEQQHRVEARHDRPPPRQNLLHRRREGDLDERQNRHGNRDQQQGQKEQHVEQQQQTHAWTGVADLLAVALVLVDRRKLVVGPAQGGEEPV